MKKCFACILAVVLLLCTLTGCQTGGSYQFDTENMHLVQFETPSDAAPVAVMETSMGTIQMVLYPEEAPKACENFMELAEEGFYNGTEIFNIANDLAFIAGSATPDGLSPSSVYEGEKFGNEYTTNLWPFSGCLGTISDEEGKSDSRFFLMGDVKLEEGTVEKMQQLGFPEEAVAKFQEVGGVPQFTQRYTIFGQIIGGQDVVNQITALEVNETLYPVDGPITIESITLTTYGEVAGK